MSTDPAIPPPVAPNPPTPAAVATPLGGQSTQPVVDTGTLHH